MIAGGVTKDFGVVACDSAVYDTNKGEINFEARKLTLCGDKIFTFIGTHLYFARMDKEKLAMPFDAMCLYLKNYLKESKPEIGKLMKQHITDEDENKPHFCLFVLGLFRGYPTIAQFNSFLNFEPKYLWSNNGLKFSTILYGDDSNPEKQAIFKEATEYMEAKSKNYAKITPGIVGEILTRGIYRKADAEERIGLKKKYAGGCVNAACVTKDGIIPLSGFLVG